ncbi:MAG: DUF6284 family protein [Carbonactinosporaceae bacterium]
MTPIFRDHEDPTASELAEIEREWPLIAAELDLLDAEIAALSAERRVSTLDRRRVRRAEHRVMEVSRELATESVTALPGEAVA